MDDPIIHLPGKVKVISIAFLLISSAAFLGSSFYFGQKTGNDEILLVTLSLAQLTITALGILFIFSFSQRSLGISALTQKVDDYLGKELPFYFRNTRVNKPPMHLFKKNRISDSIPYDFKVHCSHTKNTYNADYLIQYKDSFCSLQVNQIQSCTLCVFKVPIIGTLDETIKFLDPWFIVIDSMGFSNEMKEKFDLDFNAEILTVYLKKEYEDNYLINPTMRLQGISELSAIIRDLILLGIQNRQPISVTESYMSKFGLI